MILPIASKDNFIKSFLNPVSRLAPSSTLNVGDKISTVVHNNSNIFLRAEYEVSWADQPQDNILCLPDTVRLIKILGSPTTPVCFIYRKTFSVIVIGIKSCPIAILLRVIVPDSITGV